MSTKRSIKKGGVMPMKAFATACLLASVFGFTASAQDAAPSRAVDLTSADGTSLKGTFFAANKPGPGVLLIHQSNRDRKSWDSMAALLSSAGINALTIDMRGYGESGGKKRSPAPEDVDAALEFLRSQAGVDRSRVALGGAGWLGV